MPAASSASVMKRAGHRSDVGHDREEDGVSSDALMRWEWEGGTPASPSRRAEGARAESAQHTLDPSQPTDGHPVESGVSDV
jgi:hypothetical protein